MNGKFDDVIIGCVIPSILYCTLKRDVNAPSLKRPIEKSHLGTDVLIVVVGLACKVVFDTDVVVSDLYKKFINYLMYHIYTLELTKNESKLRHKTSSIFVLSNSVFCF